MRLSSHEREVIRQAAAALAGPDARVLLFGSRTDDDRKGGDIDLLIEMPRLCADRFGLGLHIGAQIERQLGLQKIDILVADPATPSSPVLVAARREGLPV